MSRRRIGSIDELVRSSSRGRAKRAQHAHRASRRRRRAASTQLICASGRRRYSGSDLPRVDPLLAQRPGVGELHERRADGWAGTARRSRSGAVDDLVAVAQRAVADEQHVVAAGHDVGDEVVDVPHVGSTTRCTPPGTGR